MVVLESDNNKRAHGWAEAKRLARRQGYGQKITVPKTSEPTLPPGFEPSRWSIKAGAEAVYRDQQVKDSFQVREYGDRWTIELDHHNPETGNVVAHAVRDAPMYTLAAAVLVGVAIGSSRT